MITKYLTCKTHVPYFGEDTIVARLDHDEENRNIFHTVHQHGFPRHYMTGEVATRLYEYEQLGYTPQELKDIQNDAEVYREFYKRIVNSIYGARSVLSMSNRFSANDYCLDGLRSKVTLIDEMHTTKFEPDEWMAATAWPKKKPEFLNRNLNLPKPKTDNLEIDRVIFNDPATIVFWKDGTKTVVKATNEDFDPEKGLAMAITKKALGNKGNYFETIKKWTRED